MAIPSRGKLPVPEVTHALRRHWDPLRYRRIRKPDSAQVQVAALMLIRFLLMGLFSSTLFAQSPASPSVQDGSRVEQILISGLNRVKEPVVLRQLKSQVGGLYSASNVARDHERLDRMGLFSGIDIEASPGSSGVILRVDAQGNVALLSLPRDQRHR